MENSTELGPVDGIEQGQHVYYHRETDLDHIFAEAKQKGWKILGYRRKHSLFPEVVGGTKTKPIVVMKQHSWTVVKTMKTTNV